MPRNIAQWTGIVVTTIVVLGRDIDVVTALPFGIAAGALASTIVAFSRRPIPGRVRVARGDMGSTSSIPVPALAGWRLPKLRHLRCALIDSFPSREPRAQPVCASSEGSGLPRHQRDS